jgi:hypothetical protein
MRFARKNARIYKGEMYSLGLGGKRESERESHAESQASKSFIANISWSSK